MVSRRVSAEEETAKLLSLYEARPKVGQKAHTLKNTLAFDDKTEVQRKLTTSEINLLYFAAYTVLSSCEID